MEEESDETKDDELAYAKWIKWMLKKLTGWGWRNEYGVRMVHLFFILTFYSIQYIKN